MVSTFERRARRVRRALQQYPLIQPVVNRLGMLAWRWHLRDQAHQGRLTVDPTRLVYLDPCSITHAYSPADVLSATGTSGLLRNSIGQIRGGSWDKQAHPIEEIGHLRAISDRVQGAEWDDIALIREIRADVAAGRPRHRFRTPEDVDRRLAHIDTLIARIRDEGYQSQQRLRSGRPWDEILVAYDRYGRVRFVDGRHRLAIARALRISSVPVVVALRHARWATFCAELRNYSATRGGTSYQPIPHPDLADVPADQGHERFELIAAHLPSTRGTLLDIGANKGYFCHRLEELGFECTAAERSEKELYFLEGLRVASQRRFEVFRGSVFDVPSPERFDVILALNVFHHFLKIEASYRRFERFLTTLRPQKIFFESHLPGESQMRGAFADMRPDEFAEFVARTVGLSGRARIGSAADGRPLYLLSNGVSASDVPRA